MRPSKSRCGTCIFRHTYIYKYAYPFKLIISKFNSQYVILSTYPLTVNQCRVRQNYKKKKKKTQNQKNHKRRYHIIVHFCVTPWQDVVSEHPERFFVSEIVREKILLQYQQEIPYVCQVSIGPTRATSASYLELATSAM